MSHFISYDWAQWKFPLTISEGKMALLRVIVILKEWKWESLKRRLARFLLKPQGKRSQAVRWGVNVIPTLRVLSGNESPHQTVCHHPRINSQRETVDLADATRNERNPKTQKTKRFSSLQRDPRDGQKKPESSSSLVHKATCSCKRIYNFEKQTSLRKCQEINH